MDYRIGIGYDVHRLTPKRKLVLGGVNIPFKKGPLAHSDGDVLTHAICDAMLGAAALRDIGFYFSNSDKRYKNICSLELLKEVKKKISGVGFKVGNIDSVIIADEPKIGPYRDKIIENLASVLELSEEAVNLKATTSEGVGQIGSKAIASYAVVLLKRGEAK